MTDEAKREVRKYGVRRMNMHWWGPECVPNLCEPVYLATDYDHLAARCRGLECDRDSMAGRLACALQEHSKTRGAEKDKRIAELSTVAADCGDEIRKLEIERDRLTSELAAAREELANTQLLLRAAFDAKNLALDDFEKARSLLLKFVDRGQRRLNGGPFCAHVSGWPAKFCGAAKRWAGHSKDAIAADCGHEFVDGEWIVAALSQERA